MKITRSHNTKSCWSFSLVFYIYMLLLLLLLFRHFTLKQDRRDRSASSFSVGSVPPLFLTPVFYILDSRIHFKNSRVHFYFFMAIHFCIDLIHFPLVPDLHCCDKAPNPDCKDSCHRNLRAKLTDQEIIDNLQEGGCGPPLPHVRSWELIQIIHIYININ